MEYFAPGASIRKLVNSLSKAKYRRAENLFVAEGTKCVTDTLPHFKCEILIATKKWLEDNSDKTRQCTNIYQGTTADIERMSNLKSSPEVIAAYRIPQYTVDYAELSEKLIVALDCVQDPGNLGTIIRVCDWMGVTDILASEDSADIYNPKVVQATMGSIARVHVHYVKLTTAIESLKKSGIPIYGTFLDGKCLYNAALSPNGIIVMGNEGHGISESTSRLIDHRILIPSFPPGRPTAESLNVAVATSLTLAEFRRRQL